MAGRPSSLTKESDLRADNGYAGLARSTVLRRVEGIAQVRQLTPRSYGRASRANHARRRLRSAVRGEGGAGITAAVVPRGAITRPVAREVACPTAPVSALD